MTQDFELKTAKRRSLVLGERLHRILNLIPQGTKRLVDIGCDHGRLGVVALEEGKVQHVLACDLREKPLLRARNLFTKRNLLDKVTFNQTDGLKNLPLLKDDCIVIAGMGGLEIASILKKRSLTQVEKENYYILHPTRSAETLRQTLFDLKLIILTEELCREEFKIYPLFLVKQQKQDAILGTFTDSDIFFGPILWRKYAHLRNKVNARKLGFAQLEEDEQILSDYFQRRMLSLNKMSKDPDKKLYCQKLSDFINKNCDGNEVENVRS